MTHVLIADDEPQIVELLCQAVKSLGWTFDTASNGMDAIKIAENVVPDLVISDVNMPGMRGVDVVRHMKSKQCLSEIPVVLVSSPETETEAIASGCTMFIPKPFNVMELTNLLLQVILP